jgi:hypothetical protein
MAAHTGSRSGLSTLPNLYTRPKRLLWVLFSFNKDRRLPSEWRPKLVQDTIAKIALQDPPDPDPAYYITQLDLEASLFQLGVADLEVYHVLLKLQPDDMQVRIYCERLEARFTSLFNQYDALPPRSTDETVLAEIVSGFWRYNEDARQERLQRRDWEYPAESSTVRLLINRTDQRIAAVLIRQIHGLCERSSIGTSQATSRRRRQTLFYHILGSGSDDSRFFGLSVIKDCSDETLQTLQEEQDGKPGGLRGLQKILANKEASEAYQAKFKELIINDRRDNA